MEWSSNLSIPRRWPEDGAFKRTVQRWIMTSLVDLFATTTRRESCRRSPESAMCINLSAVPKLSSAWPFQTHRNHTSNLSAGNLNPWARMQASSFSPCRRSHTLNHHSHNSITSLPQEAATKQSGTWTLLVFTRHYFIYYRYKGKDVFTDEKPYIRYMSETLTAG